MIPRGGEASSSRSILRSNSQCRACLVALALLNMSAKSWYSSGIPERSGGGSNEVEAEWSFAKSSDWRYMVNCTKPSNLQVCVYVVVLVKEIGGGVENGELEIVGISSGTIGGGVTGVDLLEEGAGGTGIRCMFNRKLILPNTQSIDRL